MKKQKKHTKQKKRIYKDSRIYFMFILLAPMIYFIYQAWQIGTFPMKFFLPVAILLLLVGILLWYIQYGKKISKLNRTLGKIVLVFISLLLILGNVVLFKARSTMGNISVNTGDTEYEIISVIVKKENPVDSLKEVKEYVFATNIVDKANTKVAVKEINKKLDYTINEKSYASVNEQANALFSDETKAIIMNEAYRSILDEKYPDFNNTTKVIYKCKIPKSVKKLGKEVDVTKESYNVYISGIDTYGSIGTQSRSDVNMIATINPKTKQILLTSVPRDYYVKQTCQLDQEDKLTHSGIFGIDCTLDSMENFTGLKFNYYVRVNFSSLESIVDALGGIDIYNETAFYSGVDGSYIGSGDIHMDGTTALKFSRERHAYADGDRQRGRNQMLVLNAIIEKATSPAILAGYSGVMDTVGNTVQTNMKTASMSAIIKAQLNDGTGWNISQQSVTGDGGTDWTPANGFDAYVMYPDMESVNTALENINKVLDGEEIVLTN